MSDSFADLWSSSAPAKPQPQKLGSPAPNHLVQRPKNDVFSLLAASSGSPSTSRPVTPGSLAQASPKVAQNPKASGDAFGSLLDIGAGLASSSAKMTIAQRAAQADKERLQRLQSSHTVPTPNTSSKAWDGLDLLAQSAPPVTKEPSWTDGDDDWGLTAPPLVAEIAPAPLEDDWGLGDFAHAPTTTSHPAPQASKPSTGTFWDIEGASTPGPRHGGSSNSCKQGRESLLGDEDSDAEDDILGVLNKPALHVSIEVKTCILLTHELQPRDRTPPISEPSHYENGRITPPPHILGRIVEMGFSVQQARIALAATDTGVDVEAALETLLANGAAAPPSPGPTPPVNVRRSRMSPPARHRQDHNERNSPSPIPNLSTTPNLQEQADKILNQASEIGFSLFSKATSAWKEGSKKVQKAYQEAVGETGDNKASGSSRPGSGASRPKWMQESVGDDNNWDKEPSYPKDRFTEDDHSINGSDAHQRPVSQTPAPTVADLFSDAPASMEIPAVPAAYVSRFRHATSRQGRSSPSPPISSSSSPAPTRPPPPKALPKRQRTIVTASSSQVAQALTHKTQGGSHYKLGQYPAAETSYSSAISSLPSGHLLLVPLHNNRAQARLKTGDYKAAEADASIVIDIIGNGYRPGDEEPLPNSQDGAEPIDLGGGLIKAWKRRAEALEGREKWDDARKDWERVAGAEWAAKSFRDEGVRGAGRCRRMISPSGVPARMPKKPPPRQPVPASRGGPTPPSRALNNLRKVNEAADQEDQAKHDLKDSVDTKLMAWRAGKETNIRALLGSLDLVLWPELGLPKSNMADLVLEKGVKVRYTRVIAKIHPDKVRKF